MNQITIAIDAMSGDYGSEVTIPACISAIKSNPYLKLILVGDKEVISQELEKMNAGHFSQLAIKHASETVAMDESPTVALRSKKDSSMRVAINLVKEQKAKACVSAGNTGALMATAKFVLKTLPGIDRPAIMVEMPGIKRNTKVMDLGANIDSSSKHLFQFAVMGSALIQILNNVDHPKIGLLNIGVEAIKGNEQIKLASQMLAACSQLNYIGYLEGQHFYTGESDLIVCDGFVGNVSLKVSEGLVKLMLMRLRQSFKANWFNKLAAIVAMPALQLLKRQLDPSRYNGATLLGLNGIVIKSHGGANSLSFEYAIKEAAIQVQNNIIKRLHDKMMEYVNSGLL